MPSHNLLTSSRSIFSLTLTASCLLTACQDSPGSAGQFQPGASKGLDNGSPETSEGSTTEAPDDGGTAESTHRPPNQSDNQDPAPNDPSDPSPPNDMGEDGSSIRFDVGDPNDGSAECAGHEGTIFCRDLYTAITCDDEGKRTDVRRCSAPDVCGDLIGCVTCLEGQTGCKGNAVYTCDTTVPGHAWELKELCEDPTMEVCDHATGSCVPTTPKGTKDVTGTYYQFARFTNADDPMISGAYDVDTFENRMYVSSGGQIAVFDLEIFDSDGDGEIEPNQHPNNPDATGPIEERTIEYVETIVLDANYPISGSAGEIYAIEDKIFYSTSSRTDGTGIAEYDLATGTTVMAVSNSVSHMETIGYDEINDIWYGNGPGAGGDWRQVYQYDRESDTWGTAFQYPDLAGSHMDGLEIVATRSVDNEGRTTYGIPYVYVSDMTSNFIGQYRLDIHEGWIQENLFEYEDQESELVEGMGFGAFNHFWAASGNVVYELGGGALAEYTEPVQ